MDENSNGRRPGNLQRHQLVDALNRTLEALGLLQAQVFAMAEAQRVDPMWMRSATGELALAPLVIAEAHALTALAMLETAP